MHENVYYSIIYDKKNWEQKDFNQATMKNNVYQAFTTP